MNKPEKLILDYSKWRCGGDGPNKLGEGYTELLNKFGFMCCLGLFESQCGIPNDQLLKKDEPMDVETVIPLFAIQRYEPDEDYHGRINTKLSLEAIGINDDPETTPEEKIELLTNLLAKEGIQLEVINKP